jgi:hypothetical protein
MREVGRLVALVIGTLLAPAASALPFTLYLSGSMETITSNAAEQGLVQGDRFDLALTLNPHAVTASFSSSIQPNTRTYFGGIVGLSGTLAGVDLALGAPLAPGALNPAEVAYTRGDGLSADRHIVQFAPALDSMFGAAQLTRLFIGFLDTDGRFLASTAFSAAPFVPGFLDELEQASVQFTFTTTRPDGSVVQISNPLGRLDYAGLTPPTPVPAPGSGLLVLTTMAALAGGRMLAPLGALGAGRRRRPARH